MKEEEEGKKEEGEEEEKKKEKTKMIKRKLRKTKKSLEAETRGDSTGLVSVQQCPLSSSGRCPWFPD